MELRNKLYRVARWSEKYMKTDMVYLTRGSFWLFSGQAVSSLFVIVLAIAFANLLPKEVYGNYKFVISLAGVLGAFSLTGMTTAVTQAVARRYEGALRQGFKTSLRWSFLIVAGGLAGGIYYFLRGNNILAISMLIVGALYPFIPPGSLYGSFLAGRRNFKATAIYNVIFNLIPVLVLLPTILATKNPVLIVFAYFLSNMLAALLLYSRVLKKFKPNEDTDPETIGYSKHLSLMNILGTIAGQIDKVLIFHFIGAVELAIYSFALAIPQQLTVIRKGVKTLALPKLSEQELGILKKTIPGKALRFLLIMIIIIGAYIFLAPFIYKFLFPKYLESVIFSQVFALSFLFAPSVLFSHTLVAHSKKKELYFLSFSNSVVLIISLVVLLPLWGLWGAIMSVFVQKIFNLVLLLYLFAKLKISN